MIAVFKIEWLFIAVRIENKLVLRVHFSHCLDWQVLKSHRGKYINSEKSFLNLRLQAKKKVPQKVQYRRQCNWTENNLPRLSERLITLDIMGVQLIAPPPLG